VETRRIGSLEVSVVGVGCNNFGPRIDEAATRGVVHAALEEGINFFDTADLYGKGTSEEFLGRVLGGRRGEVVIASKFGMKLDDERHGARPEYIRRAVEDSLRRLGTDRIDLYQLHTPDPTVPIAETLGALDELVRAGKVREIGCSNFSGEQLREARDTPPRRPLRQRAERVFALPSASRGRCWRNAARGDSPSPLLPARQRPPDGEVPPRPGAPGGTRITRRRYGDLLSDANLERVERLAPGPRRAATPCWSWPSRGSWRTARSPP
jgi:hypothetical protein